MAKNGDGSADPPAGVRNIHKRFNPTDRAGYISPQETHFFHTPSPSPCLVQRK